MGVLLVNFQIIRAQLGIEIGNQLRGFPTERTNINKAIDFSDKTEDIINSSSTMCGRSNEAVPWGGFSFLNPALPVFLVFSLQFPLPVRLFNQVGRPWQDVFPAIRKNNQIPFVNQP
ncbi:MAG TPA: hypothetical protein PLK94_07140 [Alphaproteobacteria bacterium]|nr:hypothetical protein [Alphaproteobacteria bacterium]